VSRRDGLRTGSGLGGMGGGDAGRSETSEPRGVHVVACPLVCFDLVTPLHLHSCLALVRHCPSFPYRCPPPLSFPLPVPHIILT
jgi:hypothetical protein